MIRISVNTTSTSKTSESTIALYYSETIKCGIGCPPLSGSVVFEDNPAIVHVPIQVHICERDA
jgi:hypothetical protein